MNREAKKYLFDMLLACNELESFIRGKSHEDYLNDPLLRRAVERDLEIIGESLVQLRAIDPDAATSIPDSPRIIGMRHRLIHAYAEIDDDIVWDSASYDVAELGSYLGALLDEHSE